MNITAVFLQPALLENDEKRGLKAKPESEYDYGANWGLYWGACALMVAKERGDVEKLLEQ